MILISLNTKLCYKGFIYNNIYNNLTKKNFAHLIAIVKLTEFSLHLKK